MAPAPNDTLGQRLCHSQTFRSSGEVQSFSLLGIVIILSVGGLIILVSLWLETVVGWVQRRWGRGEAKRSQWENDEKLQLLSRAKRGRDALERSRHPYQYTILRADGQSWLSHPAGARKIGR